jgi:predicted transcriptional regulator
MVSYSLRFVVTYQAGKQLDALGDSTRRAILERLLDGPLAVVDIANTLPVSRPAVSQHLKVLKGVGLDVRVLGFGRGGEPMTDQSQLASVTNAGSSRARP